jgi:hypothetical protein
MLLVATSATFVAGVVDLTPGNHCENVGGYACYGSILVECLQEGSSRTLVEVVDCGCYVDPSGFAVCGG